MGNKLKINIVSFDRRWLLDVARELEMQGYEVYFYTALPYWRVKKFGLKRKSCKSIFYMMAPFIINDRILPFYSTGWLSTIFDYIISLVLKPSDVYISVVYPHWKRSFKEAKIKSKFVLMDSGNTHILNQKKTFGDYWLSNKSPKLQNKYFEKKEIEYELEVLDKSDYILVPSQIVKQTYLNYNYLEYKLFYNPYGVDLSQFYPLESIEKEYDIIMTGNWCYRKGCDLILELCLKLNYSLLHVGPISDIPFPEYKNMTHVDPVDQNELKKYYSKAKIFVLPSREEGLALVQPQAIACELPVVCSKYTGGKDIGEITGLKDWIFEMNDYSLESLEDKVSEALRFFSQNVKMDRSKLENISWKANGERYNAFLKQLSVE